MKTTINPTKEQLYNGLADTILEKLDNKATNLRIAYSKDVANGSYAVCLAAMESCMNVIKSTKVPDVIGVKAGVYDVCKDDKTFIEDRVDTIIDGIASVPTMDTASPLVNATIGKCIDTVNECNEEAFGVADKDRKIDEPEMGE